MRRLGYMVHGASAVHYFTLDGKGFLRRGTKWQQLNARQLAEGQHETWRPWGDPDDATPCPYDTRITNKEAGLSGYYLKAGRDTVSFFRPDAPFRHCAVRKRSPSTLGRAPVWRNAHGYTGLLGELVATNGGRWPHPSDPDVGTAKASLLGEDTYTLEVQGEDGARLTRINRATGARSSVWLEPEAASWLYRKLGEDFA